MAIIDQAIGPVYYGEDVTLNFTMTPVENITGWTLQLTVTRALGSVTKVIQKTGEIISGAAGTFRFILVTTDTDVAPEVYQYDVWRTNAGNERLLAIGTFTIADQSRKTP